jgi:hypothetical protein
MNLQTAPSSAPEIDRTVIAHDVGLRDLYRKLGPLLLPAPAPRKKRNRISHPEATKTAIKA